MAATNQQLTDRVAAAKAVRRYREMRRQGYSRTYTRHVVSGTTRFTCDNARCRARKDHAR